MPTGRTDTTVTYLYVTEGTGLRNTVRLASGYAAHFNNQSAVGSYVTGFVPAQVAHGEYLRSRLQLFEIASVLLILLVVALAFRSLLAPLVVLAIAAIGYLVYFPLLDQLAQALNFEVPRQLEPVLLALLLGVVTDYCVLFFSAFRDELDTGTNSVTSARNALRLNGSVVAVAGLTVAGGTIALLAAPFEIFRALGPALALTVLVGLALCLTLAPAVMTISELAAVHRAAGTRLRARRPVEFGHPAERMRLLTRGIELLTRRGVALGAAAVVVVLLGLASLPLAQARLDLSFTAGLPRDDSVAEGAQLLGAAGIRGISAPTEVLIEQRESPGSGPRCPGWRRPSPASQGWYGCSGPRTSPPSGPAAWCLPRAATPPGSWWSTTATRWRLRRSTTSCSCSNGCPNWRGSRVCRRQSSR